MAGPEDFEDHCWKDIVTPEILTTYEAYVRDTFVGTRPALLAIDLYNLVYKGGAHPPHEITPDFPNTCGIYAHEAIEPTRKLFAACRAAQIPIFYVTARFSPGRVQSTRRADMPLVEEDYEIHQAFAPQSGDVVFRKERASAFFGTPLVAHLNQRDVNSLIVCGESTSGCVRATVVDAFSHGLHCSIVEECVFDRNPVSHKVNLFDLHHKYADVMSLDEVLSHLHTRAGATTGAA